MKQLYLTHAEVRRLYGSEHYTSPSRFLGEVPPELLHEVRAKPALARGYGADTPAWRDDNAGGVTEAAVGAAAGLRLGGRVAHDQFGEGVVLRLEGRGDQARVQVNFEGAGSKWLVLAYAKLRAL